MGGVGFPGFLQPCLPIEFGLHPMDRLDSRLEPGISNPLHDDFAGWGKMITPASRASYEVTPDIAARQVSVSHQICELRASTRLLRQEIDNR